MFPEQPMDGDDNPEEKKALLDELLEFARGGMGKEMQSRLGPPPLEGSDGAPPPPGAELAAEAGESPELELAEGGDGEIPGIEPETPGTSSAARGGADVEKLKALLASMQAAKSGGGGPPGLGG